MGVANCADLSVQIGNLKLKNPIITASGTFGYNNEYQDFMDLTNLGAIVTKGLTLTPKPGNPQPRVKEVPHGLINSIGLENVGIHEFIAAKLPVLKENNIDFIVNIAGENLEEYKQVAKICQKAGIKGIEVNLSCPNVKKGCLEFGKDEETLYRLICGIREVFTETLIVKLGSNVSFPEKIASTVERAGADAISAINTVKAMSINLKHDNKGFNYIKGGLSGRCIKPLALNFIYEIREHIDIPIIGMGGITNLNDILEFFAVGADAVQIGTATFTHPNISEQLTLELANFMKDNGHSNIQMLKNSLRRQNGNS